MNLSKKAAQTSAIAKALLDADAPIVARYGEFSRFHNDCLFSLQEAILQAMDETEGPCPKMAELFCDVQETKDSFEKAFSEQFQKATALLESVQRAEEENSGKDSPLTLKVLFETGKLNAIMVDYLKKISAFMEQIQKLCTESYVP